MGDRYRYTMLICSMPHHGPLFGASRPPLSRIRLNQYLTLLEAADKADYDTVSRLLDWSEQVRDRSDADILADARASIPAVANPLARQLLERRLEIRTVVAALRRRHWGEHTPPAQDWGYGRWVATIARHWGEPGFRLERVYPWVNDARSLLEAGATVELERLLLEVVWRDLESCSQDHEFDFEAVLLYCLRWELVARWTRYRVEAAATRFEYLVREGLSGIDLDAVAA